MYNGMHRNGMEMALIDDLFRAENNRRVSGSKKAENPPCFSLSYYAVKRGKKPVLH
jgi:hypothetical protein